MLALVIAACGLAACAPGAGTGAGSAPGAAQNAEERRQSEQLVEDAALTNKACGTQMPIAIDWRHAPVDQLGQYSVSGYCDNMLYSVRRLCEESAGQKTVQAKVKAVSCGFDASGARTLALHDGLLDYKIDFNSSNDADFAWEYLQNNL
jgi:hypothetical protein